MISITCDLSGADDDECLFAGRLIDILKCYARGASTGLDIRVITDPEPDETSRTVRQVAETSATAVWSPEVPAEQPEQQMAPAEAPVYRELTLDEEYLILRYERLTGFAIPAFEPLDKLYRRYAQRCELAETDRWFVNGLISKMFVTRPALSLENLQACYVADCSLESAKAQVDGIKRDFLAASQNRLRQELSLPYGEVAELNRWFTALDGVPQLDGSPFAWAWREEDEIDEQETGEEVA